jgi:hypothetical protein
MSHRKQGICKQCGQSFSESIGHPIGWNEWIISEEDFTPLQRWWYDNIELCPLCEKPPPVELLSIEFQNL